MKKLIFLTTAIALLANITQAQTSWVNYKIDGRLSVKMPTQPVKIDDHCFYVRTNDTCVYIISRLDMGKLTGLDSAAIARQSTTSTFANSFKTGMTGQMPGSELGEVSIGRWHDYTSYIIDGINVSKKVKIYAFTLFVGTNAYSMMAILPEAKNTSGKDYYFGSVVMN